MRRDRVLAHDATRMLSRTHSTAFTAAPAPSLHWFHACAYAVPPISPADISAHAPPSPPRRTPPPATIFPPPHHLLLSTHRSSRRLTPLLQLSLTHTFTAIHPQPIPNPPLPRRLGPCPLAQHHNPYPLAVHRRRRIQACPRADTHPAPGQGGEADPDSPFLSREAARLLRHQELARAPKKPFPCPSSHPEADSPLRRAATPPWLIKAPFQIFFLHFMCF